MKRLIIYTLCVSLLLCLSSCFEDDHTEISISENSAEETGPAERDIPKVLIGAVYGSSPSQKGDDIDEWKEVSAGNSNIMFREESLIGTTISGTFFGVEMENAIYSNSKTVSTGSATYDYYDFCDASKKTAGYIAFHRATGLPYSICNYYYPLTTELTEEQIISKAKSFILEHSSYVTDLDKYTVECEKYPTDYRIRFSKLLNGVRIDTLYFEIDFCGNIRLFNDSIGMYSTYLPKYTLEDYLLGAKARIEEYYNTKNFDFVSEIKDIHMDYCANSYLAEEKTNAIIMLIRYTVVYTDGTIFNEKGTYFYYPFDPNDYS